MERRDGVTIVAIGGEDVVASCRVPFVHLGRQEQSALDLTDTRAALEKLPALPGRADEREAASRTGTDAQDIQRNHQCLLDPSPLQSQQSPRETVRLGANDALDSDTFEARKTPQAPERRESVRELASLCLERLTGIEPATFSLGSTARESQSSAPATRCGKCRCCCSSTDSSGRENRALDDLGSALGTLADNDRAAVLAHLAALVAMEPAARAAFLALAGPLTGIGSQSQIERQSRKSTQNDE